MVKLNFFRLVFGHEVSGRIACVTACFLFLGFASGVFAAVLEQHWQVPVTPELGQTATFNLRIASWKRPAPNDLLVAHSQEIDQLSPVTWQWRGFSCGGYIWQTKIKFCFHAPGDALQAKITYLPTAEIFLLPAVAIVLPEQQLSPVWLASIDGPSNFRTRLAFFCHSTIIFLVLCSCIIGINLEIRQWRHRRQLRQSLQRLSTAISSCSAEQLYQALLSFFISQRSFVPAHNLRHLALYWRYRQSPNAWLAPALHHLAEHLDRLRFQNPQATPCLSIDSYSTLAAFIIKNHRQEK